MIAPKNSAFIRDRIVVINQCQALLDAGIDFSVTDDRLNSGAWLLVADEEADVFRATQMEGVVWKRAQHTQPPTQKKRRVARK